MTTAPAPEQLALPHVETLPIGEIKPYWRNPRRITPDAVDAVANSIRTYGYRQPIVVDADHTVIVGHTRLQALAQLGYTEVPVYVASTLTPEQVKEYRLVDNRAGEISSWDHDALVLELRELSDATVASFFPDVDLEVGQISDALPTQDEIDAAGTRVTTINPVDAESAHTTDVRCPACATEFPVRTMSLPGVTSAQLAPLLLAQSDAAPVATG